MSRWVQRQSPLCRQGNGSPERARGLLRITQQVNDTTRPASHMAELLQNVSNDFLSRETPATEVCRLVAYVGRMAPAHRVLDIETTGCHRAGLWLAQVTGKASKIFVPTSGP